VGGPDTQHRLPGASASRAKATVEGAARTGDHESTKVAEVLTGIKCVANRMAVEVPRRRERHLANGCVVGYPRYEIGVVSAFTRDDELAIRCPPRRRRPPGSSRQVPRQADPSSCGSLPLNSARALCVPSGSSITPRNVSVTPSISAWAPAGTRTLIRAQFFRRTLVRPVTARKATGSLIAVSAARLVRRRYAPRGPGHPVPLEE